MKLIKPSYSIIEQKPGLEGIYEAIETAGRLCYKSTRPEGQTAKDFVDRLAKNIHLAMLEHSTVYLKIPTEYIDTSVKFDIPIISDEILKYQDNSYSKINIPDNDRDNCYISTNYRVLIENNWLDDLKYLCEPTEYHDKRVMVHFTTSIGIGRELLRHRKFSFANESTRYCNYSKDKFDNEITFIIPSWIDLEEGYWEVGHDFISGWFYKKRKNDYIICPESEKDMNNFTFLESLILGEEKYLQFIKRGRTPQEAREVLPLATKSELIMTGFISDWKDLFNKRSSIAATGMPHPDMRALIDPLMQEFKERNYE